MSNSYSIYFRNEGRSGQQRFKQLPPLQPLAHLSLPFSGVKNGTGSPHLSWTQAKGQLNGFGSYSLQKCRGGISFVWGGSSCSGQICDDINVCGEMARALGKGKMGKGMLVMNEVSGKWQGDFLHVLGTLNLEPASIAPEIGAQWKQPTIKICFPSPRIVTALRYHVRSVLN